jgi:endogenous inhibitor of DNA gyrase (YacG/DUF329 family)
MVEKGTRKCPKCKGTVSLTGDVVEVERRVGEGILVLHLKCPACGHRFDTAIDSD